MRSINEDKRLPSQTKHLLLVFSPTPHPIHTFWSSIVTTCARSTRTRDSQTKQLLKLSGHFGQHRDDLRFINEDKIFVDQAIPIFSLTPHPVHTIPVELVAHADRPRHVGQGC